MADTITLKELKAGDIILFSVPTDDWISKIIGKITHSSVSHTGMVDRDHSKVIEEGEKGASIVTLPHAGERTLHIRRLKSEPDTDKVVDIAYKYVEEGLPYPMSNLAFLGLYMLAGEFIPDNTAGEIVKNVLKIATYELIKFFNEKFHPGTDVPPMVCSQFAAACYDEAALTYGPEYKIHYNDKVATIPALLKKILAQLTEDEEKSFTIEKLDHETLLQKIEGMHPAQFHCSKLFEHIEKHDPANAPAKVSDDVIAEFYRYAKAFLKLFAGKKYEDKEVVTAGEIKAVLEDLLRFQETFVTPEDLLNNSTNLMDMGILTYEEIFI